jgi:methionyl-tRNA synthetase
MLLNFKHLSILRNQQNQDYLLISGTPTPNGRLHLGHIAGPFLKMDVLARHLRMFGHNVKLISGTDGCESYVLLKALQLKQTPLDTCCQFHTCIEEDLKALDIIFDVFINPLDSKWLSTYHSYHVALMNRLIEMGLVVSKTERILYSAKNSRHIIGCWLLGNCPQCGADAAGHCCENCGAHFLPEQIINPQPRIDEGTLEWQTVNSLFLRISDVNKLMKLMSDRETPDRFRQIVTDYLEYQGPCIRLTQPGSWGIPWPDNKAKSQQVLFTYTIGQVAFTLLCGKTYEILNNRSGNAFDLDSDVITIASGGFDNTVTNFVAMLGLPLEHGQFRSYDRLTSHYFLNLEGQKFSTSRQHVIGGKDVIHKTPVSSDAIRYYLATISPEQQVENFTIDGLVEIISINLAENLQRTVDSATTNINLEKIYSPSDQLIASLEELLQKQTQALNSLNISLQQGKSLIDIWVSRFPDLVVDSNSSYWWLKGLAVLAYPIMPTFGRHCWYLVGHEGDPILREFLEVCKPKEISNQSPFRKVSHSDVTPCLPDTLKGTT